MSPAVQVLAVGAAAPAWRLPAADVGAAWGRGGRGQAAVCAPDEDTLTLAAEAAGRALAVSGLQHDIVDGLWWGTSRPPFAEGPSHAVLARAIGLSAQLGRRAVRRLAARRHGGAPGRRRRHRRRERTRSRSSSSPTRSSPGSAPPSRRAPVPARPRSCSCRTAAARRSVRASRARTRSSTATAATPRRRPATSTTLGSSVKRSSCPRCASSASSSRRSTHARGRSPTPTDASVRPSRSSSASARRPRRACTPSSATPVRPRRSSARSARSTRPARVAVVGFGGGRATGVEITVKEPVPGAAQVGDGDHERADRHVPRGAPRPRSARRLGRDRADGRPAGERAVRPRRRRDARAARCALRRLRDDQHAAVDPSALHRRAAARSSCSSRSRAAASSTRSS